MSRAKELYEDEYEYREERGELKFDLEENDKALDEIIEEATIFDKIDNHMKLLSVHMSAAEALGDIVAEFQVISGGTSILAQALRNIVRDNNLTGDPEKYTTTGFKE